jgi:cytochrome c oxidase subunit 2
MKRMTAKLLVVTAILALLAVSSTGGYLSAQDIEQVVHITVQRYQFSPRDFALKKGAPVVLEFTSKDVLHGFNCPDLGIRTDIFPGKVTTLRFTPQKAGTFPFHCDDFCGSGHETMTGTITIAE